MKHRTPYRGSQLDRGTHPIGPPKRVDNRVAGVSHLLTQDEVGQIFGVTKRTVQRWSKLQMIPSVKVGRTIRYDVERIYDLVLTENSDTLERVLRGFDG